MRPIKNFLEKPNVVWAFLVGIYGLLFWFWAGKFGPTEIESNYLNVLEPFSKGGIFPSIHLIRELPDWGHLGFYTVFGQVFSIFKGDLLSLRAMNFATFFAALLIFVQLGFIFTYKNRLNPLWISFSLLILAANPHSFWVATQLDYIPLFLLFLFLSMLLFEREFFGWSFICLSSGLLIDWRAGFLAIAFVYARLMGENSKVLRIERILSFSLPFIVAGFVYSAWNGFVPQGVAREWFETLKSNGLLFRMDQISYIFVLLPVYAVYFTWRWGTQARSRALFISAVVSALLIPAYFVFPIGPDLWKLASLGAETDRGLLDRGALSIAGEYKNLVLFIPWLAGVFLFSQLLLMDILDRSRWLRGYIVLFILFSFVGIDCNDRSFLLVLPAILLLSLSEGVVGEEGKLTS